MSAHVGLPGSQTLTVTYGRLTAPTGAGGTPTVGPASTITARVFTVGVGGTVLVAVPLLPPMHAHSRPGARTTRRCLMRMRVLASLKLSEVPPPTFRPGSRLADTLVRKRRACDRRTRTPGRTWRYAGNA